mmetsp:Transcript_19953/g.46417  ORF Transcript_19953/g.46417 Transcript_19953/m.46417 type:complete len:840 (+) Transcript_19953:66-2585(+)
MADGEEDDARSVGSFKSADEDDFDPVQDLPGGSSRGQAAAAASGDAAAQGAAAADEDDRWNLRKDGNKDELEPIWSRLLADREHVKISKQLSYVLRHAAHKLDVRIRKDGFVKLSEIRKLRNFKDISLEKLMAVVYFDEKERYTMVREVDGELLIRANQGHTMKVVESDLLLDLVTDPEELADCVHGTYLVHWPFIKKQGLSKVARNHIHLANGLPEDGKIRGMRSTAELFVYVDIAKAMADGIQFYKSKNDVILTQGLDGWLPVKYFSKAQRIDYNTCDTEEMEFDEEAEPPMWSAELAPSGPGGGGSYLVKNLEALISNCKKRLQEINELKASQEAGMELNEAELDKISQHSQCYTELQSLEQRFRQHKGYRRETAQEKEQRIKDEAEANTVVARKDRAITPPWVSGKQNLESVSGKATEKEKAQWAALGKRREENVGSAPTPKMQDTKKEDPWAALGRGRQEVDSTPKQPARRKSGDEGAFMTGKFSTGKGSEDPSSWRGKGSEDPSGWRGGKGSDDGGSGWRGGKGSDDGPGWRGGKGGGKEEASPTWWRGGKDSAKGSATPSSWRGGAGGGGGGGSGWEGASKDKKEEPAESSASSASGRPRFFNSKKEGTGTSWRDRMANGGAGGTGGGTAGAPGAGGGGTAARGGQDEKDLKPRLGDAPPKRQNSGVNAPAPQQVQPMSPAPVASPPAQSYRQPPPPPQHEPMGVPPQGLQLTQIPPNSMGGGMMGQDMSRVNGPNMGMYQGADMGGYGAQDQCHWGGQYGAGGYPANGQMQQQAMWQGQYAQGGCPQMYGGYYYMPQQHQGMGQQAGMQQQGGMQHQGSMRMQQMQQQSPQ